MTFKNVFLVPKLKIIVLTEFGAVAVKGKFFDYVWLRISA